MMSRSGSRGASRGARKRPGRVALLACLAVPCVWLFAFTTPVAFAKGDRVTGWIESIASPGFSGSADAVVLGPSGAPTALIRVGTALLVTQRDAETGAQRWQARFGGGGLGVARGHALAICSDGAAIVVGSRRPPGASERGFVAKLDGETGETLWIWDAPYMPTEGGIGHAALRDVVVDEQGGVFVAGARPAAGGQGGDLFVAHISREGATRWLFETDGAADDETVGGKFPDSAHRILLDADGDPIVFGTLRTANDPRWDVVLLRIGAETGRVEWRSDLDLSPTDVARGLALLPGGDLVASTGGTESAAVFRITPGASEPSWVYVEEDVYAGQKAGQKWIHDVAIAPDGDVFFGGAVEARFQASMVVGRLDGRTGSPRWHRRIGDGQVPWEKALRLEVVPAAEGGADVYVGGMRAEGRERRMSVARLEGATGKTLWETLIPGSASSTGNVAQDLVIDLDAGRVFGVGSLASASSGGLREATLISLSVEDGRAPGASDHPDDLVSIPLRDQAQLWVVLVDDVRRAYERASRRRTALRSSEVVTRHPKALRQRIASSVLVFPEDGLGAIHFVETHRDVLAERRAQAELYVERDSPAHAAAIELASRFSAEPSP